MNTACKTDTYVVTIILKKCLKVFENFGFHFCIPQLKKKNILH